MEQELLQEQKKPNALAFKVAIIFAAYILLLIALMRILKINPQAIDVPIYQTVISTLLSWATFIYAVFYVQNTHKNELGGYITFGRAFSAGFKTAAYSGLFIAIFMFVYYQILDPGAMQEILQVAIDKANGDENQLKGVEMMRSYMPMVTAFSAGLMYSLFGLVVSLITAAIIKKDRPVHFDAQ